MAKTFSIVTANGMNDQPRTAGFVNRLWFLESARAANTMYNHVRVKSRSIVFDPQEEAMNAMQGILRVQQNGPTITFQISGQATMILGVPLRRLAEQHQGCGESLVRVDLRHCTWMDSTFLGTLLLLFRAAAGRETGGFNILSPSPECRKLLRQMGVDRICTIREEAEPAAEAWTEVQRTEVEGDDMRWNMLQAHQELAELPGPTGATFREVVRCVTDSHPGLPSELIRQFRVGKFTPLLCMAGENAIKRFHFFHRIPLAPNCRTVRRPWLDGIA